MRTTNYQRKLAHSKNATAFAFMQQVQREAETLADESTVEKLTDLNSKMIQFNNALKMESTKMRTVKLNDFLNKMLQNYSKLKVSAKGLSVIPSSEFSEIAKTVTEVLQTADNLGKSGISYIYTKCVTAMSAVREKTDPKLLTKSGLEQFVKAIEDLLTDYKTAYDERNAYRTIRKESVQQAKSEAIDATEKLVIHLAWLEYAGNADCTAILNRIDNSLFWLTINKKTSERELDEIIEDSQQ